MTHRRTSDGGRARRLTKTRGVHWVGEEMAILQAPATYEMKPENAWKRLKRRYRGRQGLAVLVEAAAWRERQAQERDIPRGRIMKDDALYEIATQLPRSLEELEQLRAIPRGFSGGRSAQGLIEAIERGLAMSEEDIPVVEGPEPLPPGIGPLVELLKVLLKLKCEKHDVAQKLVANVSDLELIAAHEEADVPALKGWRRELFGEDALRLKKGELALGAQGKKIVLIETGR